MTTQTYINALFDTAARLFEQSDQLYKLACKIERAHRDDALEAAYVQEVYGPLMDRHADAISPNVPEGYDTILGYLAKHHPDVLDTLDYSVPEATQRDGYKLAHWTREQLPLYVEAPKCLENKGIFTVRAYPVALLQQRWG